MFQLLIVDDEKWEREGLRDFLDWSDLGIEVVGCACNGVEGLEMARAYRPDIVITDIIMPKIDGIQMSRNIRSFLPDTKIIVLSGHDDFQYAKQSIGFHAYAYILKPIEKRIFEDTVFSVLKVLEQEKSLNKERNDLESQWSNYVSTNRDYLLSELLERKKEVKAFYEFASINGLKTQSKKVMAIMTLCGENEKTERNRILTGGYNEKITGTIPIILNEKGIVFSFIKSMKEVVLCMDAPATQSELETKLMYLMDKIKKELGIETIIGVGEIADDLAGVSQSYIQAKKASGYRFLAKYGELVFYSKCSQANMKRSDETRRLLLKANSVIKRMVSGIQKGDNDECSILLDEYLVLLSEYRQFGKILLTSFFTKVMSGLIAEMPYSEYENLTGTALNREWFSIDFGALNSLSQTKQYILSFLEGVAVCTLDKKCFKHEEVAKKVIEIIKNRYSDKLDLKMISEDIHLSPYYVGSIFKRYTGKAFSKYLNDYRMEIAIELIRLKKIKVCQLGETIGIRNLPYFSSLFKSKFGISPDEYKKIMKGRQGYV